MTIENFPSKLLENAVNEFSKLPGIGKKTALRLVLHLLKKDVDEVQRFSRSLTQLREEVKHCKICRNISDLDTCNICGNQARDHRTVCVVENIRDVMSIENTQQFQGAYHVLGGIISPMEGIGPGDLNIVTLEKKVSDKLVNEIILALPTTMEGDTTNFYIYRKLNNTGIAITTLARGLAIGDDLEFADEITLGRSLINRLDFESTLNRK